MTAEEILKLKADLKAAELAAKQAADDAAANPTDPQKQSAKVQADAELERARKALTDAELRGRDTSAEIQKYKARVILLTAYLLAVVLFSAYMLAGFFMAETDPAEVDKRRDEDKCCIEQSKTRPVAPRVTDTNANANMPRATRSNANRSNANVADANLAGVNANANSNSANSNAGVGDDAAAADTGSGPTEEAASEGTEATGDTDKPGSDRKDEDETSPTPDPAIPEMSIPKNVYVRFPGFSTGGIWSAESYVFLIVFFAGMLGSSIRALHSLVKHLGLKDFSLYWSWFYITLPFSGSALALIIYFVLRGGFYGGGFGKGLVLNIFSFAALAGLTGLFTDNAMERLKQAADTMLAEVPSKVDNANEIQAKKEAEE